MPLNRREFVSASLVGLTAASAPGVLLAAQTDEPSVTRDLQIAAFRFDVSPPIGHSCCGGWIQPVVGYDDPQEAIGFVLLGAGEPIVICAVDWTGILNEAHVAWRTSLAEAAGTTPDRVAVQCVHQHNAPFVCLEAERITQEHAGLPHIMDVDFFYSCLERGQAAIEESLQEPRRVTHIATGQARVERVAANRRILGPEGQVRAMRGSSSRNPELKELAEGLIDPYLKTVAFYDGAEKVLACHYYACHPMSYYGDGMVSADFCGLARRQREQDEPGCIHLYFDGCGGNIASGKYNDGSPELRPILMDRMYRGIFASEEHLHPQPIESVSWTTCDILPPTDARWNADAILEQIADESQRVVNRNRPSYTVAWIRRHEKGIPIVLSALHVNNTSLLHLPAECFVEYQLEAQQMTPNRFVACAAYGDGGPWYIPTRESYPQGGYEVSVAWCDREVDSLLLAGIRELQEGTDSSVTG